VALAGFGRGNGRYIGWVGRGGGSVSEVDGLTGDRFLGFSDVDLRIPWREEPRSVEMWGSDVEGPGTESTLSSSDESEEEAVDSGGSFSGEPIVWPGM
jgi:hypothetical protein